jgi:hypothetical protein
LRIRKKNTGLRPIDRGRRALDNPWVSLNDDARAALAPGATDLRVEQAMEIVAAYSEALERVPMQAGVVADAAALPYPKDIIKWALLIVLEAAEPSRRERLKAAFIALSEWQVHADFAQPFDSMRLRRKLDPLALAGELGARRTPEDRWKAAAREEQSALVAELKRRDFW